MSALPPEVEPALFEELEADGYQRLWRAALSNLLGDAYAYWIGKRTQPAATVEDLREAFDDVLECGPITRRFAWWNDMDPEYVSAAFIRWCEDTQN